MEWLKQFDAFYLRYFGGRYELYIMQNRFFYGAYFATTLDGVIEEAKEGMGL